MTFVAREMRRLAISGFVAILLMLYLHGVSLIQDAYSTAIVMSHPPSRTNPLDSGDSEDSLLAPILVESVVLLVVIRISIALMPVLLSQGQRIWGTSQATLPLAATPGDDQPVTAGFTARQLRERAWRLRRVANIVLAAVIVLLLWGFFAFGSAEEAALRWDGKLSPPIRADIQSTRNDITEILNRMEKDERDGLRPNSILQQELASRREDLAKVEARLDQLSPSKAGLTPFLVSTLSTKIGSVLLLIFLVQLLSNLYRYNLRLASFSDSRADFLQLLDPSMSLSGEALAAILSAEAAVDIDKTPPSPVQHAIELIQTAAAVGKKS